MTDEASTQTKKSKKSRGRKFWAWTGAVTTGIIITVGGGLALTRVSSPPAPKPDPTPVTTTSPPPTMPVADPPIVDTVPQADAPITVTFNHGAQCNHVFPAPNVVVDGDTTTIVLNVAGKTDMPVVLTGMRVSVGKRSQPTGNSELCSGTGESVREFTVDLDQPHAPLVALPGRDKSGAAAPPMEFPLLLSLSDPEALVLVASTRNYDCTWTIGLDWTANGQSGTYLIDDHGAPFRTVSTGSRSG